MAGMKADFLKKDIEFYTDMLIENEAWITHHLKKRAEYKAMLDLKEKQLHDHKKFLEEYKVKD